jgi:hypothetical protein
MVFILLWRVDWRTFVLPAGPTMTAFTAIPSLDCGHFVYSLRLLLLLAEGRVSH